MAFNSFPINTEVGSNNPFPKVKLVEQSAASVPTPPAGTQYEFIDSTTHHVCRKDSSNVVTDLENVGGGSGGGTITSTAPVTSPQGRLTLTTGVPWIVSSVTAATTIYYTPAVGNLVPIYDGSNWNITAITELSQLTTDTTKSPAACGTYSNYDIFVWRDTSGSPATTTIRATRGPAWTQAQTFTVTIATPAVFTLNGHGFYEGMPIVPTTNGALPTGLTAGTTYFVIAAGLTANAFEVSTTVGGAAVNTSGTQSGTHTMTQHTTVRGTGAGTTELQFVSGILTNKNAITNGPAANKGTYVGTIRTNASSQVDLILGGVGVVGGESTALGLWNMYNRSTVPLVNFDTTDSWQYTIATWRMKNAAATGNGFNNRIQVLVGYQGDAWDAINNQISGNTVAAAPMSGIGLNTSTALALGSSTGQHGVITHSAPAAYRGFAPLGANYLAPIEYSTASGVTTWFGDAGGLTSYSVFSLMTTF